MNNDDRKKYSVIDWKMILILTIVIIIGGFVFGICFE